MSAHHPLPPTPYHEGFDNIPDLPLSEFRPTPSQRIAGWSAEKQAAFLRGLSEGLSVGQACRLVGLSKQSAYAFRRSAKGVAFGLGWQAAMLCARDFLADELFERALHGTVDTVTRPDGSEIERHRYDNRLGMQLLNRLDRMADRAAKETTHAAARLIAQDLPAWIDLVERDAGPARAGLHLAQQITPASEDDLAPLRALARADTWLRSHTDLAEPLADLDPADRAGWSGEDWNRAEVAGLVGLVPAPPAMASQPNQHFPDAEPAETLPVWWDEHEDKWRTSFPPPEDFYGEEDGEYGEEGYSRELTAEEEEMVEAPRLAEIAVLRRVEGEARDRWFGSLAAPVPDGLADPGPQPEPATEPAAGPTAEPSAP